MLSDLVDFGFLWMHWVEKYQNKGSCMNLNRCYKAVLCSRQWQHELLQTTYEPNAVSCAGPRLEVGEQPSRSTRRRWTFAP